MGYYITYKKIGFMKYVIYYTGKPDDIICKCYTKYLTTRLVEMCRKARDIRAFKVEISSEDIL